MLSIPTTVAPMRTRRIVVAAPMNPAAPVTRTGAVGSGCACHICAGKQHAEVRGIDRCRFHPNEHLIIAKFGNRRRSLSQGYSTVLGDRRTEFDGFGRQ